MMYEDDLDDEWEDFDRLVAEYNLRKRKVLASPIFQRRHVDDLNDTSTGNKDILQQTAFYPCPPTTGGKDEFVYPENSVRKYCLYNNVRNKMETHRLTRTNVF